MTTAAGIPKARIRTYFKAAEKISGSIASFPIIPLSNCFPNIIKTLASAPPTKPDN